MLTKLENMKDDDFVYINNKQLWAEKPYKDETKNCIYKRLITERGDTNIVPRRLGFFRVWWCVLISKLRYNTFY